MKCSECGSDIPRTAWSCPRCGNPADSEQTGTEISRKGMTVLLVLFILVPVLLFLIHILFPDLM
jgi:predicted amidophosphoribosyltransferase